MILRDWYNVRSAATHCRSTFIGNAVRNMTSVMNCSVLVYYSIDQNDSASKSGTCAPCDKDLFKKYHSYSSDFLSDGFWNIETRKGKPNHLSFQPSICKFSTNPLDSKFITRCLAKRNITKIIIMGSSNGKRLVKGLVAVLRVAINSCKIIRQERSTIDDFWPDLRYFLGKRKYNLTTDVVSIRRRCMTCKSELNECRYKVENKSRTLVLEHLAMNEVFGNNMRVIRTIEDIQSTNNSQDIIFKYYLKDNYPDVLILVMPCIHEIFAKNVEGGKNGARLKVLLQQFLDLLKKTVPKSTQIFWVPSHYFYPPDLEKVRLCNDILFEVLKDEISAPDSNMHATLNLFEIGCSMNWLRVDFAHMAPTWYHVISRHLMEQLCN